MNKNSLYITVVCLLGSILLLNACHSEPEPEPELKPEDNTEEEIPEGCIKDYDGNIYETVTIGDQTWMSDYLKVTHYEDGTPIYDGTDSAASLTTPYYEYPGFIRHFKETYGLLYNWQAATRGQYSVKNPSGVQGACPDGWHIPSIREWKQLLNFVSSHSEYICGLDNTENIAKALASKEGWNQYDDSSSECSPGYNPETNNLTGLSLKPIGSKSAGVGYEAMVWSTSENGKTSANYILIACDVPSVTTRNQSKDKLIGVRCVKD